MPPGSMPPVFTPVAPFHDQPLWDAAIVDGDDQSREGFAVHTAFEQLLTLAGFLVLGFLLRGSLFVDSPAAMVLQLLFLVFVLLGTRHWLGTVLLGFVLVDLFFSERASPNRNPGLPAMVFSVVTILFLALGARLKTLRQASRQTLIQSLSVLKREGNRLLDAEASPAVLKSLISLLRTAVATVAAAAACVLIGKLLLASLPSIRRATIEQTVDSGLVEFVWPGPVLLIALLMIWILVSELAWRMQTPAQSSMYVRSQALKIWLADFRLIVRARLKELRRRRKRPPAAPVAMSPPAPVVEQPEEPQRWL
ncbi:MAG: hypothetical protein KDA85_19135, partial [Planctomycetaceae bacterium]|nr:hypothetical protein [Planctomycetaceae bacterium]